MIKINGTTKTTTTNIQTTCLGCKEFSKVKCDKFSNKSSFELPFNKSIYCVSQ